MTLVFVMQHGLFVLLEELLPRAADRNNFRTEFCPDGRVRMGDFILRLRRVLPRPRQIQRGLRARSLDRLIEEADVFVHANCILDRQGALVLQHDVIVARLLHCMLRFAFVPMHAQRRATRLDQPMIELLATRGGQLGDQSGYVIARSEAVADEQHVKRCNG